MVRHGIPNEKSPESVWAPAHDRGAARRVAGQLLSTGAMNANPCRVAVTYRRHELAEPASTTAVINGTARMIPSYRPVKCRRARFPSRLTHSQRGRSWSNSFCYSAACGGLAKHGLVMTDAPTGDEPRDRAPTDASLYALEKLAQAVDELATGAGNLRDRLYEAAYYVLRVQPDEIPEELRHVLVGLKDDLHFAAQPKWDEGGPVDALKITDDEDAKAVAHRILELYRELWIRLMR